MDGRTRTTLRAHLRFKLLTHALEAPMRVNVTSERILTHPGIKVKSGISQRLFPVMKSPGISKFCL